MKVEELKQKLLNGIKLKFIRDAEWELSNEILDFIGEDLQTYADEVSRDSKRRHAIDFLNYMSCIEDFKDPNGLDKENAKIYDNWLKEQEEKKCKYCTIKITEGDTCFNCSIELRIKEQEEQYCPYCQATFEKCDCDEWFGNNKG